MEKINERFYQIRKNLDLSQVEMGNAIGISASGVSNIEKGIRSVTKKHIRLLSAAFNVEEEWLEHGTGTMFRDSDGTIISQLSEQYNLSSDQTALIRSFLSLTDSQRDAVVAAVCNAADAVSAARKVAAEKEKSQREEAHQLLDMELDAQEKGQSVSTFGNSGTSVNNKQNA